MDGFKISFTKVNGDYSTTWFGKPVSNIDLNNFTQVDIVEFVSRFFYNAHPGCKVLSIESCKYDDFKLSNVILN